jgi:hypothetical protein
VSNLGPRGIDDKEFLFCLGKINIAIRKMVTFYSNVDAKFLFIEPEEVIKR